MSNENGGLESPATTPKATSSPGSFSATCVRHNVVVEFRPFKKYRGEFGFDWLRVFEGPDDSRKYAGEEPYIDAADIASGMSSEPVYIGSKTFIENRDENIKNRVGFICGGAARPSANAKGALPPDLTAAQAKAAITSEYESLPVTRHPKPTYRLSKNYVPYLNLFPEGTPLPWQHRLDPVRSANPESGYGLNPHLPNGVKDLPAPPCEARLRVLVDIKDQAPTKIGLRYNGKFLKITGTGTTENRKGTMKEYFFPPNSFQRITKGNYKESVQEFAEITIKCIKATPSNLDIIAYAYDCNGTADSAPCGKLIFLANDPAKCIKKMKIALVSVETNIDGGKSRGKIGTFNPELHPDELTCLYNTLYQALILPDVINTHLESSGTKDFTLDLSKDSAFLPRNPWKTEENFTMTATTYGGEKIKCIDAGDAMFAYTEKRMNERYPGIKKDYWIIFSFAERGTYRGGAVAGITGPYWAPGVKIKRMRSTAFLFSGKGTTTLAHELLHSLNLPHTHADGGSKLEATQKYIFLDEYTTNIMSYNPYGYDQCYSTWRWQWKIMQQSVSIGPVQ